MAATVSDPSAPGQRARRLIEGVRRAALSEYLVLWLSLLYLAAVGPWTPGFLSVENATNVLLTLAPLFLLAVGQTLVLIAGGIDLSVTATVGLTSVLGAQVAVSIAGPLATPIAIALMLLAGTAVGLANGWAVERLRMPAFLVTLTSMMFFGGLAIWVTQSRNIGNLPPAFTSIGGNLWMAGSAAAVIGWAAHLLLTRTIFGRWIYAVGHNRRAAAISGVPVTAVSITCYALCGAAAAAASLLYTGQAETGSPVLGQRVLLDVIGATVLGGTSLFGGKGKIAWTLCGVLFLKVVDNTLNLLSLSLFTITIVKGAVILTAALLDAARTHWLRARP